MDQFRRLISGQLFISRLNCVGPTNHFVPACTVIVPGQAITMLPPSMVMLAPRLVARCTVLPDASSPPAFADQCQAIARLRLDLVGLRLQVGSPSPLTRARPWAAGGKGTISWSPDPISQIAF
jgi:hypothetical protein